MRAGIIEMGKSMSFLEILRYFFHCQKVFLSGYELLWRLPNSGVRYFPTPTFHGHFPFDVTHFFRVHQIYAKIPGSLFYFQINTKRGIFQADKHFLETETGFHGNELSWNFTLWRQGNPIHMIDFELKWNTSSKYISDLNLSHWWKAWSGFYHRLRW